MHIRSPINIKSNKFLSMNNPEHCIGFTQASTRTEEMPNECIAGMGLKDFSLLDVTALQSDNIFPLTLQYFLMDHIDASATSVQTFTCAYR